MSTADTASTTYTPAGTISGGQFTGSQSAVTIVAGGTTGTYTPKGTVSISGVEGAATTFSGSYTPAGTVTVQSSGTSSVSGSITTQAVGTGSPANYVPAGSISQATFSGNTLTSTGPYTPEGTVSLTTASRTADVTVGTGSTTYKPSGTVTAPTISVNSAGSTTSIPNLTAIGKPLSGLATAAPGQTAPANAITYYDVPSGTETLRLFQIGATTANAATTGTAITVKTGDASYTASTSTLNGDAVQLKTTDYYATGASFVGKAATISVSGDPTGSISTQSFTGTGARLIPSINVPNAFATTFAGTPATIKVSGTPNISGATATFSGSQDNISGVTTAAGSVSNLTFNGTPTTITVTPDPIS